MKFFKKALLSFVLITLFVTLVSCGGKKKVSLSASSEEITVSVGDVVDLKLSASGVKKYSEEDILSNLKLSSSDDKVIKIKDNEAIAVEIGTAEVTATWKEYDGATVTVKVNVVAPKLGVITYSELPENIFIGDTFTIEHQSEKEVSIKYETSDENILSVKNNKFTAESEGEVIITATVSNGYEEKVQEWVVEVTPVGVYKVKFEANKEDAIWPTRAAKNREEIVNELFKDLYEWAQGNGETSSFDDYVSKIKQQLEAYEDIKLRNPSLKNNPSTTGQTNYFLNTPKYYQKWSKFFLQFNTAMLVVSSDQNFYTDTYAAMVRMHQFISWNSSGEKYFSNYIQKMCDVTPIKEEVPSKYKAGQELNLPVLSLESGLKFLGWYDNPEFSGNPITKLGASDSGNKVFYAKWEEEVFAETFDINQISELLLFTSHQLVWTIGPENVTDNTVKFYSSDESVATVNARGVIKALSNGITFITVQVNGNRDLDVKFELEVYTGDYIDGSYETNSYVLIDENIKLNGIVNYRDESTSEVVWESLTPEIATVDESGNVTGINAGEAKIVAKDPKNAELKLEFVVMVLEELPEGILELALRSNESNVFTRYNLNIGNTYRMDILGSVSKLFGNSNLRKDTTYYDKANQSKATYGKMSSIEFITVHYTGNMAKGANAAANASYFATNGSTSIHYTTGNDGIFYCMDESKGAWHAGDSGALAQVGEFKWIPSGVKVAAGDPMYPNFTISDDFYYEINGKKTTIPMPKPWNYSSRGTDHKLNADGTISSNSSYNGTAFYNREAESFINDQGLPFTIVGDEYYMGTTWWAYTQVYEGRICSTGGNRNSIGIESCVNEGSDLWWTWQKTAQLVADIMVRNNLDITRVRGHHFYTAKDCPQPMLENDQEIWYKFLELVEAEYELLTKYAGYEVTITSSNSDIVNNNGRVIKQPNQSTCVTYTITFTKDGESKSITLASMVKGLYVDR